MPHFAFSLLFSSLLCGVDACSKQTPSAVAMARAQCTTPTDLKVDRISWKLWQPSRGETSGYYS